MGSRLGGGTQVRARTPLQLIASAVVILIDIVGIVTLATGHRELGRALVGFGVVSMARLLIWLSRTTE